MIRNFKIVKVDYKYCDYLRKFDNKVSYNAKILKEANVTLDDINHTLNFTVHIVNNSNRKFYCNMSINLALDEDFLNNGYSYIRLPASDGEYKFFRE